MLNLRVGPRGAASNAKELKYALFDIDNTLVGNESPDLPTQRFKQAVDSSRTFIKIGIISARPLSKVQHILDYIDAEGLTILCNGAQIIDSRSKSVVAEWPIAIRTCNDVIDFARAANLEYWINDDGIDYFPSVEDKHAYEKQSDIWDHASERLPAPNYEITKPFVIVLSHLNEKSFVDISNFVQQHVDNEITSFIAHQTAQEDGTYLYSVFVVNRLGNKKDALYEVARLQNVSVHEVLVVGDGRNDAVVVGEAGIGVAMGNSAQETLAVAHFIAPNYSDDGAAIVLEAVVSNLSKDKSQ